MSTEIQVGDPLPSVDLYEGTPKDKVNIADLFKGKKGILFAVPGAFTPGCHKSHLPGYVDDYDKFAARGVELIVCVSVNDPFVMTAWGESKGVGQKIRMLADTCAEFTKAIGLSLDVTSMLGGIRSKRYAMIVDDGMVSSLFIEPDGTGLCTSLSGALLKALKN